MVHLLEDDLSKYPGTTHDERVGNMLKEAKNHGYNIIPFIDGEGMSGMTKAYSIFKRTNGEDIGYAPYVEEWIEGVPKI